MSLIWVLALFGVGLAAGLFFIYQWWTSDEEDEGEGFDGGRTAQTLGPDGETTLSDTLASTSEEYRGARKSRMMALKHSLEASLETRHGAVDASAKDRLTMPWFMLIGSEGSGKTTLLANNGLPLPYGPAFEVDSRRKDAGRWWLYEDAVVLEAPAALPGTTANAATLSPDQTQPANTGEGWNTLLHMLRTERPDSPLNGIIITVSAQDLLASRVDPAKLRDQVDRMRVFLERARKVLDVRLPLHLLVTKCDTLPGFKSFARNLPAERRNDIFGWSNPNKVEAPFNPDWVDLGMAALKTELDGLRDELLAAPDELVDVDGLFVFVKEFDELHEPLKEFVTQLFEGNEKRPALFLRGMYFCGDAIEGDADPQTQRAGGARATLQISAEAVLSGKTTGHNLVFLRSLFRDKIFKEAGLAKPVGRFRLSRDRRVTIAQAAALVFLLLGGGGLWTTLNGFRAGGTLHPGLRHDADAVTAMLAGMAVDIDEIKRGAGGPDSTLDRRLRDAAVIEVVSEMRNVETIRKSAFIPASWFSPLPGDIRNSMVAGLESIVLPVSRQRLEERIDRLVGDTAAVSDPVALTDYLNEVKTLSRHIGIYNTLAARDSGTVAQLAVLLDYLYGERPLEEDSAFTSRDFRDAIREASAARIVLTPAMVRSVLGRSVGLVASVARNATEQLVPRPNAAAERAVSPAADVEALRGLRALVELSDKERGLVASVSDSAIFGLKLARIVEDSIGVELRMAGLRLWRDTLSPAGAEERLRNLITELFQLRLMDAPSGSSVAAEIEPHQRLRWDVGRLELVQALRGEYDKALFITATSFPNQPQDRFRRAFDAQLRSRVVEAAASAQRFSTLAAVDSLEMKAAAANLELAAPRVFRAAQVLDTLGEREQARRLVASATRHAEQVLVMAQTLFEQGRYFVPNTMRIATWQGVLPLSHAAMGIVDNDTLRLLATLATNVRAVYGLSRDAAPAVRFLKRPNADSTRVPKLLATWDAIGTAVERWDRGDIAASSLGALQSFIRSDMGMRDLQSCATAAARTDTLRSGDALLLKRRQYRMAMAGRCGDAGASAVTAYQRLRAAFNGRVAGRYPFADTAAVNAPDAEVAEVREVLRQYDAFVASGLDYALRSDPRLQQTGRAAMDFLEQLERARAFLSVVADHERRPPEFLLLIGEGDAAAGARAERWVYGQPVRLLSTAADSAGLRAEVTVTGPWAALRAARMSGVERVRIFDPDTRMELGLPGFPASAPDVIRR